MISFINSFLSYVVLMLIIVGLSACAVALGLFLRKRKNQKMESAVQMQENTEV